MGRECRQPREGAATLWGLPGRVGGPGRDGHLGGPPPGLGVNAQPLPPDTGHGVATTRGSQTSTLVGAWLLQALLIK